MKKHLFILFIFIFFSSCINTFTLKYPDYKPKGNSIAIVSGLNKEINLYLATMLTESLKEKSTFRVLSQKEIINRYPEYPVNIKGPYGASYFDIDYDYSRTDIETIKRLQKKLGVDYIYAMWVPSSTTFQNLFTHHHVIFQLFEFPETREIANGQYVIREFKSEDSSKKVKELMDIVAREMAEEMENSRNKIFQEGIMRDLLKTIILIPSLLILSCGGGGGGGDSGGIDFTTINTPSQGGQAAGLALSSINNLSAGYTVLTGLIHDAGGSGASVSSVQSLTVVTNKSELKRLSGLLRGATGLLKKAISRRTNQAISLIQAQTVNNCGISGTYTYDDLGDSNPVTYRMTFNSCRESYDASTWIEMDGTIELNCSDSNCTTEILSLGSRGSAYRESYFSDSSFTIKTDEFRAESTISLKKGQPSVLLADGYIEYLYYFYYQDGTDIEKDRLSMSGLRMESLTTSSGGSITTSITANGTWAYSYYLNGSLIYSVSTTFNDLNYRVTDVLNSYSLLTVNGQFTVGLLPDNTCFEGTFNIITEIPVRYDYSLMRTIEGRLRFNDSTVVTFNYDGTITVTVNGNSITYHDEYGLYNSCPLI